MMEHPYMAQGDQTVLPPSAPVRALLLDDSSFDRARIRRLSGQSGLDVTLDEVGSIEELDVAVRQESYDLILIDYRLPVGDGMVALEHVLNDPRNSDAGKIMITGNGGISTAVEAMRGGCHDFLTKDEMDSQILSRAMTNALTVARERREIALQIEHQRAVIKDGLVAALSDKAVAASLMSLMRAHLEQITPALPQLAQVMDPADVQMLIQGMDEEDEFIFFKQ